MSQDRPAKAREPLETLSKIYSAFDIASSGQISGTDFKDGLTRIGMPDLHTKRLGDAFAAGDGGNVDYLAFLRDVKVSQASPTNAVIVHAPHFLSEEEVENLKALLGVDTQGNVKYDVLSTVSTFRKLLLLNIHRSTKAALRQSRSKSPRFSRSRKKRHPRKSKHGKKRGRRKDASQVGTIVRSIRVPANSRGILAREPSTELLKIANHPDSLVKTLQTLDFDDIGGLAVDSFLKALRMAGYAVNIGEEGGTKESATDIGRGKGIGLRNALRMARRSRTLEHLPRSLHAHFEKSDATLTGRVSLEAFEECCRKESINPASLGDNYVLDEGVDYIDFLNDVKVAMKQIKRAMALEYNVSDEVQDLIAAVGTSKEGLILYPNLSTVLEDVRWNAIALETGGGNYNSMASGTVQDENEAISRIRNELRSVFSALDRNDDGVINRRELILSLRKEQSIARLLGILGPIQQESKSRSRLELVFQNMDSDGSQDISLDEFLSYAHRNHFLEKDDGDDRESGLARSAVEVKLGTPVATVESKAAARGDATPVVTVDAGDLVTYSPKRSGSVARYTGHTGYLLKKGQLRHNWKRRFFVSQGTLLLYFESPETSKPKGVINVDGATIIDVADGDTNHPHAFEIQPSAEVASMGKDWSRVFHLRAESDVDKAAWLENLRRAAAGRTASSHPLSAKDFYLPVKKSSSTREMSDRTSETGGFAHHQTPEAILPKDLMLKDNSGLAIPRLDLGSQQSPPRTYPLKKKRQRRKHRTSPPKQRRFSIKGARLLTKRRPALFRAMQKLDFQENGAVLVSGFHRALVAARLRAGHGRDRAAVEGETVLHELLAVITSKKERRLFGKVVDDMESIFAAMDRNSDGFISIDEFASAFRRLDLPAPSEQLLSFFDENGDGEVDFIEFLSKLSEAKQAEKTHVKEQTGFLTVEEVESLQLLLGVEKGCVKYGVLSSASAFKSALFSRPKQTPLDGVGASRTTQRRGGGGRGRGNDGGRGGDTLLGTPVRNLQDGRLRVVSDEEKLTKKMVDALATMMVVKRRTMRVLGKI